jgi:long-chain acyl-CoA synthetase
MDPEATEEMIDEEGWVHTGDVGLVDQVGRLRIVDHIKNIMKLSQREHVALEKNENVHAVCPIVQQIYVRGDSFRSYTLAIVVPDPVLVLAKIASEVWKKRVSEMDSRALDEAVKDEKVVKGVLDVLTKDGVRYGLKRYVSPPLSPYPCGIRLTLGLCRYEFARRLYLTNELFSVENHCLMPAMEVCRRDVQKRYKAELDALYALGESAWSATLAKL